MENPTIVGTSPRLFGRSHELDVLETVLARGTRTGGSVLLRGDAGVGKSSLLGEASKVAARHGYAVLSASGIDGDAAPFVSLRRLLPDAMIDSIGLSPAQRGALLAATRESDGAMVPEPFLVAMAVLTMLTALSEEKPIALLLDDAHWIDQQSRTVMGFLGRRLGADPVVLVAAARPVQGHGLEASTTITVPPLPADAANELLSIVAPHLGPAGRKSVLRVARGNPLALNELSRTWARPVDRPPHDVHAVSVGDHIRASFGGSYERLESDGRDALLIAALDEQSSNEEVFRAASALHGAAITPSSLDQTAAVGLTTPDPDKLTFRHPLVRAAIVDFETTERVRAAHRALAGVLLLSDRRRALIHSARGSNSADDGLADELVREAEDAKIHAETTTAIALVVEASSLTTDSRTRGHRLLLAATWAYEVGESQMVESLVASASAEAIDDLDTIRARWLAEIFTGRSSAEVGRIAELKKEVERAWRSGDLELAWNVLMSTASRCYWTMPDSATREALAETARTLPAGGVEHRLVFALSGIDQIAFTSDVLSECEKALKRGTDDANALRMYAMGAVVVGDAPMARVFVDEAERQLRSEGRLGLLPHVLLTRIQADWVFGDWDRMRSALDEGRRLAEETGQLTWRNSARLNEARLAVVTGELAEIDSRLEQIEAEAIRQGTTSFLPRVQVVRGMALVARRDHENGFHALTRVFDATDPLHDPRSTFPAVMFLAEAAKATGLRQQARDLIAGVRSTLGPIPPVDFRVVDAFSAALLAEEADAEPLFLAALDGEAATWPWVLARLRLAYGTWLRRQRRDRDAVPQLHLALNALTRLGAAPWVDHAKVQLRAAGAQDELSGVVPHVVLNAHELQIASLAASGMSNREIAEQLFLSPRTIGSHLYRMFPKLGVTSRGQLAALLDASR